MAANEATRQGNNFGGVLIGMVVALMLAGAAGLVLSEHGVIAIKSNGELVQPTADVAVPTRGTGVVNPPNSNGGLTAPQGAPQGNVESVPTVAPVGNTAPVTTGLASGLTEGMTRKFDAPVDETGASTDLASGILSVVESWENATPIPGGEPPKNKDGGKSFDRQVSGGTSGGKHWEPKP